MKKFTKILMGVTAALAILYMIHKGYSSIDVAVACICMAIGGEAIIDGLDYIMDKAKGE